MSDDREKQSYIVCSAVADAMYEIVDTICRTDEWSDEKILSLDSLFTQAKKQESLDKSINSLATLINFVQKERLDKKASMSFQNRKKLIECTQLILQLQQLEQKGNDASKAENVESATQNEGSSEA